MNYLPVNVYAIRTNSDIMSGDCSNRGVTLTDPDRLVVPCPDGHITEADVEARGYIVLEPMKPAFAGCPVRFKPRGITGLTMSGGNYVHTSDSRFRKQYGWHPISVHDRVES